MSATGDDDQFRFDMGGLKFLVQVRRVFKRDDVVLVAMDLHDWRVVFADKGNGRDILDQTRVEIRGGSARFVTDQLAVGWMAVGDAAQQRPIGLGGGLN